MEKKAGLQGQEGEQSLIEKYRQAFASHIQTTDTIGIGKFLKGNAREIAIK